MSFASKTSASMTETASVQLRDSSCLCSSMVRHSRIFILSVIVACGYYLEEKRIAQLNQYLDDKKVPKIDERVLVQVLTHLKELELLNEQENESDEYRKSGGTYNCLVFS